MISFYTVLQESLAVESDEKSLAVESEEKSPALECPSVAASYSAQIQALISAVDRLKALLRVNKSTTSGLQ